MRLSSTQRTVLEAMNDGLELHIIKLTFIKVRYALWSDRGPSPIYVSPATFQALLQRDYIDSAAPGVCRITDKGRAVIAEVAT